MNGRTCLAALPCRGLHKMHQRSDRLPAHAMLRAFTLPVSYASTDACVTKQRWIVVRGEARASRMTYTCHCWFCQTLAEVDLSRALPSIIRLSLLLPDAAAHAGHARRGLTKNILTTTKMTRIGYRHCTAYSPRYVSSHTSSEHGRSLPPDQSTPLIR